MADKAWPPPGPWQTIPGIARLVEKSAKSKALSPKTTRYCTDPARDDLGRFAGCNSGGGGGGGNSDGGSGSESGGSGASSASGSQGTSTTVEPITAEEARGDSRPVSADEFQSLANEGQASLQDMADNAAPPSGLDQNWSSIQSDAYQQVQASWGGATYDAHTGQAFSTDDNVYAMSVKPEGVDSVSVPENATADQFNQAMDTARSTFSDQLSYRGGALGVFHDDELGRIDIDPVITVDSLHDVETIGAYTHAIGGAYNFADGNGYWPPHVAAPAMAAARGMRMRSPGLPALRKKNKKPDKPVFTFDVDNTITEAPKPYALISSALRAAGCHVVVVTGHGPKNARAELLDTLGFEYDDIVIVDPKDDGSGKAKALKELGSCFHFDNCVEFGPEILKVCPVTFQFSEPPGDSHPKKAAAAAKDALKGERGLTVNVFGVSPDDVRQELGFALRTANAPMHLDVSRPARKERRGPPRIPTNYDPHGGTPESRCGNCDMFWQGMCWGYGDVRVDPVHGKCDEWTAELPPDHEQPAPGGQTK